MSKKQNPKQGTPKVTTPIVIAVANGPEDLVKRAGKAHAELLKGGGQASRSALQNALAVFCRDRNWHELHARVAHPKAVASAPVSPVAPLPPGVPAVPVQAFEPAVVVPSTWLLPVHDFDVRWAQVVLSEQALRELAADALKLYCSGAERWIADDWTPDWMISHRPEQICEPETDDQVFRIDEPLEIPPAAKARIDWSMREVDRYSVRWRCHVKHADEETATGGWIPLSYLLPLYAWDQRWSEISLTLKTQPSVALLGGVLTLHADADGKGYRLVGPGLDIVHRNLQELMTAVGLFHCSQPGEAQAPAPVAPVEAASVASDWDLSPLLVETHADPGVEIGALRLTPTAEFLDFVAAKQRQLKALGSGGDLVETDYPACGVQWLRESPEEIEGLGENEQPSEADYHDCYHEALLIDRSVFRFRCNTKMTGREAESEAFSLEQFRHRSSPTERHPKSEMLLEAYSHAAEHCSDYAKQVRLTPTAELIEMVEKLAAMLPALGCENLATADRIACGEWLNAEGEANQSTTEDRIEVRLDGQAVSFRLLTFDTWGGFDNYTQWVRLEECYEA